MALDINGEKSEVGSAVVKPKDWTLFMLRLSSLLATAAATIVMALNNQTKTLVVATVGSTPITATLTAKFQHNPAFVFFVIANGMASLHNLLMIALDFFRHKFNDKGLFLVMIPILDMLNVALASAGDGAAAFMAELGKNGNSHARWNKICDKFGTYCDHGGGALIASFIGLGLLLVVSVLSIIKLLANQKPTNYHVTLP
ncbi:hypothetical protein TIFTF001_027903 [Ficus carica]|uniref:CASP-like protein n=1 Tax=Ficus carica TaxID=3494 RepID=A0AA88DPA4_FICCA|nr:hypothetical protein TIFTF001_027903 [Ficus carica]